MTAQSPLAIFFRFLRFGLLAWGGPVAQIAMIKRELVEEERWVDPARFNRLLAVYQALPGPEAHELCVHFGMMKGGRLGGLLAGLGFMLPGFLLVLALAWLYQRLDFDQPGLAALFLGLQIGVVALIVRAVHRIAHHALGTWWLVAIAVGAAGIAALSSTGTSAGPAAASVAASASALALFLTGLKAGLLTFGGAYTAIPFVRADAVGGGWVSEPQFLDSLALSGVIPAPLIIFATFVGYLAGGFGGALAITAGIFLPAFAMTLLFYDRLERVIEDERLHRLLAGVAAAVVGFIAVTAFQIGASVARSLPSVPAGIAIFVAALAAIYGWRSRLAIPLVIFGSGLAGLLAF